jgi:hypothetical protein
LRVHATWHATRHASWGSASPTSTASRCSLLQHPHEGFWIFCYCLRSLGVAGCQRWKHLLKSCGISRDQLR